MVLFFTSTAVDPAATIYMGRDKVENEELIRYGDDEDVWFHVDKLSSAHIYLRLPPGTSWNTIPAPLLEDCSQLTKANSIGGNKLNTCTIIYTPWRNIKKTGDMAVGSVTFHNERVIGRHHIAARDNAVVNRLNKTKREEKVDHETVRQERERDRNRVKREEANRIKKAELDEKRRRLAEKEASDYSKVYSEAAIEAERERKVSALQRVPPGEQDDGDGLDSDDSFM